MKIKISLLISAVVLALAFSAFAEPKEGKHKEELKLADCPAAVQKTITDNAGGGTVGEVEKTTKKDGTIVYEADVKKADGKKIEIKVAADGKLIKVSDEDDDDDKEEEKDGKDKK
ncbi:MAG: hypothetical protein QM813_25795 [Verrucomicrobiota bacterium]